MKKKKTIIIGTGNFAMMLYDFITYDSDYEVTAFTVNKAYMPDICSLQGLPVVPFEEVMGNYPPSEYSAMIGIGYPDLNRVRERMYLEAKRLGYECASYVGSKSMIWRNSSIGENCIIMDGACVEYDVKIGNNVVMWPLSSVGHQSIIGDNCWLSGGCHVSGLCKVGKNTFFGVNSSVKGNTHVADFTMIGANVYINQDTKEFGVFYSQPGKDMLKDASEDDRERLQSVMIGLQEKSDKKDK